LEELSGFTYNPEAFTTESVRVRLSGWKDMDVPESMHFMLEIVKDMHKTIKQERRKVLVHCHAGYGRTGIVLACYLIYDSTDTAEIAIKKVKDKRSQCIQKKSQFKYCKMFKNCKTFFIYL
jgi:protein tyrosine phosphatase domain-containing protein 1